MIETDLLLSYFTSSLSGFRQFAGRFGNQGSRLSRKIYILFHNYVNRARVSAIVYSLAQQRQTTLMFCNILKSCYNGCRTTQISPEASGHYFRGLQKCSRNVINQGIEEAVNSSLRKATKKGSFPREAAVMQALYLRVSELCKKWNGRPVANKAWPGINCPWMTSCRDDFLDPFQKDTVEFFRVNHLEYPVKRVMGWKPIEFSINNLPNQVLMERLYKINRSCHYYLATIVAYFSMKVNP